MVGVWMFEASCKLKKPKTLYIEVTASCKERNVGGANRMNRDELLANVDTIFIVIMENRSFDHVFGSRCLPAHGGRTDLEGITSLDDDQFSSRSAKP